MIFFRKRLFWWLLRAYLKRWGRRILFFFLIGLLSFFGLLQLSKTLIARFPVGEKETIGMRGAYTVSNLPPNILSELSRGLTKINSNGIPVGDAASSWKISNSGKTYTFSLKQGISFFDGDILTSDDIQYNFSDVKVDRPDRNTIIFTLKESYSPFLVTVSKPIFKTGLVGIGEYKIKDIKQNAEFIEHITLSSIKNTYKIRQYRFYPTGDALKLAFLQGEVSKTIGLSDTRYKQTSFFSYPNVTVEKKIDYSKLVTLFFNTRDGILSDPKVRSALSYTIPNDFPYGERSHTLYPPGSWVYSAGNERGFDIEHARLLLASSTATESGTVLSIKTLSRYSKVADDIASNWKTLGITTKIEEVDVVPDIYQIFIGDFTMPKDPDQYTLWHSNQPNNITKYNKERIDKLLEDGRRTTDNKQRLQIYSDLQKYLLADSPALFLYFPYHFNLERE